MGQRPTVIKWEDTSYMVHQFCFTVADVFTEYFGLYVVPFLRFGYWLIFMCANKKQKYDGHIYIYSKVQNDEPYMKYLP
jgi:hypothetical protein